jgi:hypothetical protein
VLCGGCASYPDVKGRSVRSARAECFIYSSNSSGAQLIQTPENPSWGIVRVRSDLE